MSGPAHIGLGKQAGPLKVEIWWPGGGSQTVDVATVDRVIEIRQQ
jgi:hypothetical protein